MRPVVVLPLVLVAACGRFGFGSHSGDDDTGSDGAGSDARIGDGAGSGDGTGGDAAAYVCPAGVDLCDTFEAGGLDTATWTADSMVSLDITRAHRGVQSVHVHMAAFGAGVNSHQTLGESKTIALEPAQFYVRAWFWLSALPAGQNGMELISAERPSSAGDYVFVFSDSTHVYSQFASNSMTAMTTVPVGQWFCAVFEVVRSTTTTGSLTSSGDLAALTLPGVKTDSSTSPMTNLFLGIGFSSSNVPVAQPALDLWIDDVIVDAAPVTCTE